MCFSSTASFIASIVLISIGIICLIISKKELKLLSSIPLLFGVQQLLEGLQWLYLYQGLNSLILSYGFLFFGFILWPVYVPLIVFLLEKKRRKYLKWFLILGIITSLIYLYGLIIHPPTASIVNKCVYYDLEKPFGLIAELIYFIAVFGSLILSGRVFLKIIAILVAISAGITQIFYYKVFASVWCFFAAAISSLILIHVLKNKK